MKRGRRPKGRANSPKPECGWSALSAREWMTPSRARQNVKQLRHQHGLKSFTGRFRHGFSPLAYATAYRADIAVAKPL